MTEQQIAFLVAQMEAVALAVAEHLTVGARAFFHPRTVAELLETGAPDSPEIVVVDVALRIVGTDARTGRY